MNENEPIWSIKEQRIMILSLCIICFVIAYNIAPEYVTEYEDNYVYTTPTGYPVGFVKVNQIPPDGAYICQVDNGDSIVTVYLWLGIVSDPQYNTTIFGNHELQVIKWTYSEFQ